MHREQAGDCGCFTSIFRYVRFVYDVLNTNSPMLPQARGATIKSGKVQVDELILVGVDYNRFVIRDTMRL